MADSDAPPVETTPRSPLHVPVFRAIWVASLLSNFGGLIQSVGAAWMMTSLTRSPQLVSLVQASTTLPLMLLSLWAGAIADNLDRRKVMLGAHVFMLIVSIALALCTWLGWLTPWLLLSFTFLVGCGFAVNLPSWQASVGAIVPRAMLPSAIALNSMAFNVARSLGPALGGAIVAAAGAAAAFLVNAFSYFGMIFVMSRWRPVEPLRLLPRENLGRAMAAGVRYATMSPHLRVVILRAGLFGLAGTALLALMPLIARDRIGGGALGFGVLLGAYGIGAVIGALSTARLRAAVNVEWLARIGMLAMAGGTILAGLAQSMIVILPAMVAAGAGWVVTLSTFNVVVQLAAPRWVVARCLSIYQMSAFGGMALGSWMIGALADLSSVTTALVAAGLAQAIFTTLGLRLPLPETDNLNLDPLEHWMEPATAVPVQAQSGPVTIVIEWRIAPEHAIDFLRLMNERSRIRRRDGARHWALMRDLADVTQWVERYDVPTWLDYIRHNNRRTHADVDNMEQLFALHQGADRPRVRRLLERQTAALAPSGRSGPDATIAPSAPGSASGG